MPLQIGRNSIAMWQVNFGLFVEEFGVFTAEKLATFDCAHKFDLSRLEPIHTQWKSECDLLARLAFSTQTAELSDLKAMALLVAIMARYQFVKVFHPETWDDPAKAREHADLMKNPELVIAFDFALNVIDWFENQKPVKKSQFTPPVIPMDVRNDLFSVILSHKDDGKTVAYAIFSALYRRI